MDRRYDVESKIYQVAIGTMLVNAIGNLGPVSQFSREYAYWANGAWKPEGQRMKQWPTASVSENDVLAAVTSLFYEQRAAGNRVAVWREFPEVYIDPARKADPTWDRHVDEPERWSVIMRLHFMTWDAFLAGIEPRL